MTEPRTYEQIRAQLDAIRHHETTLRALRAEQHLAEQRKVEASLWRRSFWYDRWEGDDYAGRFRIGRIVNAKGRRLELYVQWIWSGRVHLIACSPGTRYAFGRHYSVRHSSWKAA